MQSHRKLSIFAGIFLCAALGVTAIMSTPITVKNDAFAPIKFIAGVYSGNNVIYAATQPKTVDSIFTFEEKEWQALYAEAKQRVRADTPLHFTLLWQPDGQSRYNKDTWFMLSYLGQYNQIRLSSGTLTLTGKDSKGYFISSSGWLTGINHNWIDDWRNESFESLNKGTTRSAYLIKTDDIYKIMRLPKGGYTKDCNPGLCSYDSAEQKLDCRWCYKSGAVPAVRAELKPVKPTDNVTYDSKTGKLSKVQNP